MGKPSSPLPQSAAHEPDSSKREPWGPDGFDWTLYLHLASKEAIRASPRSSPGALQTGRFEPPGIFTDERSIFALYSC
jgi:hypothetical protein